MQNIKIFNLLNVVICTILCMASGIVYADSLSRGTNGVTPMTSGIGMAPADQVGESVTPVALSNAIVYDNSANKFSESEVRIKVPKFKVVAKVSFEKIQTVNKIVAFVNKGVITSNQVDLQVQQTLLNFKSKNIQPPTESDIRTRVVEQLIMQRIQLDTASRYGIKTSDIEVANAVNNIVAKQNMTVDQLTAMLVKQGGSYEGFRQQVKDQITMEKLRQREVDSRVIINDDEVNRVMSSEAFKKRIDYNLSDIIISMPEQQTLGVVQDKEAIANQAYNELKSGVPFYQVSAKYSNSPNALQGGELGWRNNATLPAVLSDELAKLAVGEFTPVIKMPVGFFIFKVNNIKKHGSPQIVRQYHVRHILIKVNEITGDGEAQEKIIKIKNMLDKDAETPNKLNQDFIKLAKQYSEDSSSINGGDIGWVSKGDTVPTFEQAILETPVGVVSEPIHTPFGWHILEVIGVRDSNLTDDRERAEVRQELHENKATMMYDQWLRDIRENAYVKMNDY